MARRQTNNGLTPYQNLDVDQTEDQVSANPCELYHVYISNAHTKKVYVKFFDALAANVTVGTTTATVTYGVPNNGAASGSVVAFSIPDGMRFATGLTVAAVVSAATGGSTGPGANACVVSLGYVRRHDSNPL